MEWEFADAKDRLSELINQVISNGPQRIRRRADSFIVISERDYLLLVGKRRSLKELLLSDPKSDQLQTERDPSPMRDAAS